MQLAVLHTFLVDIWRGLGGALSTAALPRESTALFESTSMRHSPARPPPTSLLPPPASSHVSVLQRRRALASLALLPVRSLAAAIEHNALGTGSDATSVKWSFRTLTRGSLRSETLTDTYKKHLRKACNTCDKHLREACDTCEKHLRHVERPHPCDFVFEKHLRHVSPGWSSGAPREETPLAHTHRRHHTLVPPNHRTIESV